MSQPIQPQSVTYFHGKITREQGEELLLNRGGTEGLFLLRESVNGNFAVSICYNQRVHHYNVERQSDGSYQIPTGRRFIGPIELVRHHSQHLDGFLTLARFPLERNPSGLTYYVLQGVTAADLEERLRLKAIQMGLKGSNSIEEALSGPMRDHLRQLVLKDLHNSQPWFHDIIHRTDAESRLSEAGHTEGQYLVRCRREDSSFVLSISFQGQPKHYKINYTMEKYQIEGGHYFNSLIEMIDHYHFRQDGLLCKLRYAVESPRYQRARSGANSTASRSISGASTPSSLPLATDQSSTPPQIRTSSALPRHSLPLNNSANPQSQIAGAPTALPTFSSESSSPSSQRSSRSGSATNLNNSNNKNCGRVAPDGSSINNNNISNTVGSITSPSDLMSFTDAHGNLVSSFLSPGQQFPPMNIIATNNIFMSNQHHLHQQQQQHQQQGQQQMNTSQLSHSISSAIPLSSVSSTPSHIIHHSHLQQQQHFQQHIITPLQITQNKLEEACNNFSSGFTPTPTPANPLAAQKFHSSIANNMHPLSVRVTQSLESLLHNPSNSSTSSTNSPQHFYRHHHNSTFLAQTLNQPAIMDQEWEEPELGRRLLLNGILSKRDAFGGSKSDLSSQTINKPTVPVVAQQPNSSMNSGNNIVHTSSGCPFMRDLFTETTQVIYDSLPVDDETFNLEPHQISIKEKLGGGNFGHVFGGIYQPPNDPKEVPVAIKMLKQDQVSHVNEDDILMEAKVMSQLKHRHIVRLIGVCRDVQVMLVLELAPLGPINKHLRKNMDMSFINITELMYQVALGMAYLEASKFVHRDLAARNVLLVTEKYAKISDFGMSKALKFGNDYYRAANAGKWPIKWYAPECIYYFKFDSKSDVWSYGVTMWESYSYGERPYKDMKGTQILSMIDRGKRLPRPHNCPESIYDVMLQCWEFDGVRRPTFAELVLILSRILNNFHTSASHGKNNNSGGSNNSNTVTGGSNNSGSTMGVTSQSMPSSRYGSGSKEGGSY